MDSMSPLCMKSFLKKKDPLRKTDSFSPKSKLGRYVFVWQPMLNSESKKYRIVANLLPQKFWGKHGEHLSLCMRFKKVEKNGQHVA